MKLALFALFCALQLIAGLDLTDFICKLFKINKKKYFSILNVIHIILKSIQFIHQREYQIELLEVMMQQMAKFHSNAQYS